MKHLVIGQRLKTPNFSAFHWSPRGSLVSIGQHFIATRVVHLPKRTETSLITESDQSGPNRQLLQLCTARTAWSDSDQAVRAVHSFISWLSFIFHIRQTLSEKVSYDICKQGRFKSVFTSTPFDQGFLFVHIPSVEPKMVNISHRLVSVGAVVD